jgi:hypothetical protein
MFMNADKVEAIASEIIEYLRSHPDAADTAEGITQWWLSNRMGVQGDVGEALRHLKAKSIVACANPSVGSGGVWRLSKSGEKGTGAQQGSTRRSRRD